MQIALYYWALRKGQQFIVPNIHLFTWESDLISVTKAGFVHEYEIKRTRADFWKDFKKKHRHRILSKASKPTSRGMPNYFWFVCPEGVLSIDEIPEYAGLIEIRPYDAWHKHYWLKSVLKKAPRLHKEPLPMDRLVKLATSLVYRMWHYMIEQDWHRRKHEIR